MCFYLFICVIGRWPQPEDIPITLNPMNKHIFTFIALGPRDKGKELLEQYTVITYLPVRPGHRCRDVSPYSCLSPRIWYSTPGSNIPHSLAPLEPDNYTQLLHYYGQALYIYVVATNRYVTPMPGGGGGGGVEI